MAGASRVGAELVGDDQPDAGGVRAEDEVRRAASVAGRVGERLAREARDHRLEGGREVAGAVHPEAELAGGRGEHVVEGGGGGGHAVVGESAAQGSQHAVEVVERGRGYGGRRPRGAGGGVRVARGEAFGRVGLRGDRGQGVADGVVQFAREVLRTGEGPLAGGGGGEEVGVRGAEEARRETGGEASGGRDRGEAGGQEHGPGGHEPPRRPAGADVPDAEASGDDHVGVPREREADEAEPRGHQDEHRQGGDDAGEGDHEPPGCAQQPRTASAGDDRVGQIQPEQNAGGRNLRRADRRRRRHERDRDDRRHG